MKILITGADGFIGENLVKDLKEHEIIAYDEDLLKPIKKENDFPIIIHLASNTNTLERSDEKMLYENVSMFLNLINFAAKSNSKVIYASSGAVYGQGDGIPLNTYGFSKKICDTFTKEMLIHRMPIVGLRFFNVYGPGEREKGKMASMITQWYDQIKSGRNPICYKTEAKRDFVYVKDVVKAIKKAFSLQNGIYDVGTGKATSFHKILEMVQQEMGTNKKVNWIECPHLDKYQMFTKADIRWGFEPEWPIDKGIKDYLTSEIT